MKKKLNRTTLKTSRLLDYCSEKSLALETGHNRDEWPLVILKELLDNALDACEDIRTAPAVSVIVDKHNISIADNGPGVPAETITGVLDFSSRISSREHYVSPTRGAQGNALKTVIAIPFVLDGSVGHVEIIAKGIRHAINVKVDRIRQEPVIVHNQSIVKGKKGTIVTVRWPDSASSILESAKARFLQIAHDYTVLNPHLSLTIDWQGELNTWKATNRDWRKWLPSDPTSPHWYTQERFERLICGYLSHVADNGRQRLVRELVAEFDGLTATAKQKLILEDTGLPRQPLSAFRNGDGLNHALMAKLLEAMKRNTKPIKPARLGFIGKEHLAKRFEAMGCEMETFNYRKVVEEKNGVPSILEVAFAATSAAFDRGADDDRRIITGINWSPALGKSPFRQLGNESLDSILQEQRAGYGEPIVFLLHLVSPQIQYTDRGKSAVVIGGDADEESEADEE
jgi:DNA topoisomerase VI subunit B